MMMDVTDVIGEFGAWQRRIFYVLLYRAIPAAFVIFNVHFFSSEYDSEQFCCVQWNGNITFEKGHTICDDSRLADKCEKSIYDEEAKTWEYIKCALWEFKSSEYGIRPEWNLVCHRSWLIFLNYVILTVGSLISYIPAGHLCDRYGRRRMCLIGMTALVVVGVVGIFSPNIEVLLVVRLMTGIAYAIYQTAAVCLFVESVSPKFRISMSLAFMGTWGLGIMILPGVAFLLKDWRMLQLVTCILSLISPILVWIFVPESPRWLLAVGRDEEAKKIICQAAKLNGIEILDADSIMQDLKRKAMEDEEIAESISKHPTFSDLWHSKTIKRITTILYLAFFTTVFIYYGCTLALETQLYGVLLHLKIFAIGLGEVIGSVVVVLEAKFATRRQSLFRNCFFSAFFFLIVLSIQNPQGGRLTIAVFGMTCNSIAYTFLWLLAAEIFPTNLRAAGISTGMCVGRIGSISGALMVYMRYDAFFIFALLSILTGAMCLLLPNIREKPLPDTIEESKRLPETIEQRGVDRSELILFLKRVFIPRN